MKRSPVMTSVTTALLLLLTVCATASVAGDAAARLAELKRSDLPSATWTRTAGVAASPAPELILVTESYCGPCQTLKRNLKAAGIKYRAISIADMRDEYNRTVSSIPYVFYIRPDGQRVGSYGSMTVSQAETFVRPLSDLASAPTPASVTCTVRGKRNPPAILDALVTHVAVEAGAELPMGGLADIHIPLSTKISDALVLLSHKQEIRIGRFVVARWKDLSITSSEGRTVFNSPVTVEGKALGVTITATLKEIYLHDDGRTLDITVDGLPDLRLVFTE